MKMTMRTRADARRMAYEAMFLPQLPSLYNFAVRLVKNPDRAEDLVQDTALRAYRFFDRFEPGTNARAWLFKILKNTFVNQYHYRNRRPEQMTFEDIEGSGESLLENADVLLARDNPESEFVRASLESEVGVAIDSLPVEFRSVVHLNLVEGFTYQETADILSIPIGTVMSRLHRGRKLLQRRLAQAARDRGFENVGAEETGASLDPLPASMDVAGSAPVTAAADPWTY